MFLRAKRRFKDGKEHRYWSIVENRRTAGNRVVQRHVLYLGEINDAQRAAWCKSIEVLQGDGSICQQMALFSSDREAPSLNCEAVQVKLSQLSLHHPRQWGGCWLALHLWEQLQLDVFWTSRLRPSRKGTRWLNVFKLLVCYRLLAPGSEWHLHREWYERSAMADLLGEDYAIAQKDTLYRCLDKLLAHKKDLFSFLTERWKDLFGVHFDILLYDLTSTYFESDPPEKGKRQFGYSRDKRSDCVQVVLALIVTPQGFPIAYEVMAGNTSDKTTLEQFLQAIERQYGKANRTWVMDRGIPTEEVLTRMRESSPPAHYLVGTPKGRLTKLEKQFLSKPWEAVRSDVNVKLLEQDGELYVLARSEGRVAKERSMRHRRLKKLWNRLKELRKQKLTRDELLLKIGAAKKEAGRAYYLVDIHLPQPEQEVTQETFHFHLKHKKLRTVRRREGCYLLRSNLTGGKPTELWVQPAFRYLFLIRQLAPRKISELRADKISDAIYIKRLRVRSAGCTPELWRHYIQLTEIEQAFKELKGDCRCVRSSIKSMSALKHTSLLPSWPIV